jgi:hypothetical protein
VHFPTPRVFLIFGKRIWKLFLKTFVGNYFWNFFLEFFFGIFFSEIFFEIFLRFVFRFFPVKMRSVADQPASSHNEGS